MKRILLAAAFLSLASLAWRYEQSVAAATPAAPRFEVDPFWPKPLPNHWVVGAIIGVAVDSRDHVWIVHR
ncbi:MAG: hypothetical protein ACK5ZJ_22015, partial [Acidobacteriota bacterium]